MVTEIILNENIPLDYLNINDWIETGITMDARCVVVYIWNVKNHIRCDWFTTINKTQEGYTIYPLERW